MNTYAQVLTYAIPGFVVLIIVEYIASLVLKKEVSNSLDTISSLSSGMTNTLKDVLKLAIVIVSYEWMYKHIASFHITSDLTMYVVCFVLVDFASYWSHRWNHEINVMWNRHIIHHSSEEFNLSCALRQSISGLIGIYFFLYVPMALVGVEPVVVSIVAPLHLFAQFWYHTRLIKNMGFLEKIIVTPSHHRVHHAINPEYIDKNYAAIFIIWDKIFGTFKEEDPSIPPVYGVKKPVRTWNPFLINFQHIWQLAKDAWLTDSWSDKVKVWFMPTGWRPKDVMTNHPISTIEDVYTYEKYMPSLTKNLKTWSWAQLIINNFLMYCMLINIDRLGPPELALYATFLAISIFSYTSLMDKSKLAIYAELVKFFLCLLIFIRYHSWFDLGGTLSLLTYLVPLYVTCSLALSFYFLIDNTGELRDDKPRLAS